MIAINALNGIQTKDSSNGRLQHAFNNENRVQCFKVHSHRAKAEAKVKLFFDVCRLFFDLFCLYFIIFAFALTFVWCAHALKSFSNIIINHGIMGLSPELKTSRVSEFGVDPDRQTDRQTDTHTHTHTQRLAMNDPLGPTPCPKQGH